METYRIAETIDPNHPLLETYLPLVAQLLVNKNIHDLTTAKKFIRPDYNDNHDPLLLFNNDKVIKRIHTAISNNERITIYADYDADGIPGAVILSTLFDKIGYKNYDIYIPHRHNEGYGLHTAALEKIHAANTKLIITIDLGITAIEQAKWCKENGIDLIITDHHLPKTDGSGVEELPDALIVNPKQSACQYPEPMLCGAGVIFKTVQAFIQTYGEEFNIHTGWEKWLLDMVGLATISDLVPLTGENRIFAKYGIEVMKKTKRGGLKKLMWDAGINTQYMTTGDIGFNLTPRINAASRMSHPQDALAMLRASKAVDIEYTANLLTELNNTRKKLTRKTTKEAIAIVKEMDSVPEVIVVGNNDWSIGIAGLVASKLVDTFKKPAFVWTQENGIIKGSARSFGNIHLLELMKNCPTDTFIGFGGHKEAAGFSCDVNNRDNLQPNLEAALSSIATDNSEPDYEVTIDAELTIDDITLKTYKKIQQLAPFGMENEEPIFIIKNIIPEHIGVFGKNGDHTEILFSNSNNEPVRGICFFKKPDDFSIIPDTSQPISVIGTIEFSSFMGKNELRLKIIDINQN